MHGDWLQIFTHACFARLSYMYIFVLTVQLFWFGWTVLTGIYESYHDIWGSKSPEINLLST